MGLPRSTYYYKPKDKNPPDMELAEKIEKIALDYPSYGYPMATEGLLQNCIARD